MNGNRRAPDGYRLWGNRSFAHICFESPGCRFRRAGYCVMCDYGAGRKLTASQTVTALEQALDTYGEPIHRLLLGSCGSIFDEEEFSREALFAVAEVVAKTDVQSVMFETHYTTVSDELLIRLRELLPDKQLAVELGFESSDPETLSKRLHKYMDLAALKRVIAEIRTQGFDPILNVFLGAPGLAPSEQLEDALRSLRWAYTHGAEETVVFPANLKPGTELWNAWQRGAYEQPSLWMLAELLNRLNDWELERTSISWFGDRQVSGIDTDVLPPLTCEQCKERMQRFCLSYMSDFRAAARRKLLAELFDESACACRTRFQEMQ